MQGQLNQLNVLKKEAWTSYKDEVKRIKQEISLLNAGTMFSIDDQSSFEGFAEGTLLRFTHNVTSAQFSKKLLKEVFSHFGPVAYIDCHGKAAKQVTIRFSSKAQTSSFLAKAASIGDHGIDKLIGKQIKASDAFK